jgi:hypothetical protein
MMYEGTYWCDVVADSVAEDDSGCLTREFHEDACDDPDDGSDPLTYAPIEAFISSLDTLSAMPTTDFYPAITSLVDWDRFLSMWAVDSVIGHWDGYEFDIINNYRLYHDPESGLITFLPSGTDQTFVQDVDPWAVGARIPARCLMVPACEAAFAARLAEAADAFEAMNLADLATAAHEQIRATVMLEQGRNVGVDTLDTKYQATLDYIAARPARIREILAAHGF